MPLNFRRRWQRIDPPPSEPAKSYGLFSVSAGDILLSRPLFDVILQNLKVGSPAAKELAERMEATVKGMY